METLRATQSVKDYFLQAHYGPCYCGKHPHCEASYCPLIRPKPEPRPDWAKVYARMDRK